MGKKSDYQKYFPAAIHEPLMLGAVDPDEYEPVTIKFNDGAIFVLRGLVRQEDRFVVLYSELNGVHVFNADCIKEVI